jgi:uncharacterized protein (TIGR04141 family)
MSREKSQRINIQKIKEDVSIDDIDLKTVNFVEEYSDEKQKLFIQPQKESKPSWREYLGRYISSDINQIINKTSSFVLLYKHNDSLYALTGGYGYNKIKKYIQEDFGVNIALRMIEEKEGISALKQRSMKGHTRQIYRAVSGYDPLFDRENYMRILNAIQGKGKFLDKRFGVVGKTSLILRTTKDIENLNEVFDEIENIAAKEEKIHFPKSYKEVKDPSLKKTLDLAAFDLINKYWTGQEDRERLYLEFEDPFVQFRCDKFKVQFKWKSTEIPEFDLDVVRKTLTENGVAKIDKFEDLEKIKFTGVNEDGFEEFNGETLWELLICEIDSEGRSYIKIKKQWLQILDEVKAFIDTQISSIEVERKALPEWDKKKCPKEIDYNNYVAKEKGWKCMDQDFVYIEGKSKIEVCDVFNKAERKFFHIKETWGSKSAYLFTQGMTAAEFFSTSSDFRKKCSEKWPSEFDGAHKNYQVVFGIASEKDIQDKFPLNMTYFAKLNLYNAAATIKNLEYTVKLVPIKITTESAARTESEREKKRYSRTSLTRAR